MIASLTQWHTHCSTQSQPAAPPSKASGLDGAQIFATGYLTQGISLAPYEGRLMNIDEETVPCSLSTLLMELARSGRSRY